MELVSALRRGGFILGLLMSAAGWAQASPQSGGEPDPVRMVAQPAAKKDYSPYVRRAQPTRPYFGDTHLHSALSLDARAWGNVLEPEAAFRFARGEEITTSTQQKARLSRPLDFLVVSDHSEALGAIVEIVKGNPAFLADPVTKRWNELINKGGESGLIAAQEMIYAVATGKLPAVMKDPAVARTIWQKLNGVAEQYNEPGRFTTLLGYEWTSHRSGNNLHRVVIFRDGKAKVDQLLPFSALDSENPADLWAALAGYEQKLGVKVLAIAHNGNLSNGRMFGPLDFDGAALTRKYAETRSRWEPLYEVTQIKGDGESHKFLSPNDEFAGYETWDKANLDFSEKKRPEMLQYEYARQALKLGLRWEQQLGVNPFKFGMIGSTDSHTSLATGDEDNFFGKHSGGEPRPNRWEEPLATLSGVTIFGWEQAASGYAAVWATDNTREAIFDAMMRKETYATTGPRMIVRFFGGWSFVPQDVTSRVPASMGYEKGVPMGGDLPAAGKAKAPSFLVAALKDPQGANLDRVQIVKGWTDKAGGLHEQVYDVAWAGKRKPNAKGKLPAVGNTVDLKTATWTNSIGASELITVWRDPKFDPAQRAFYYARVIEIPTPRWTAYDTVRFGVKMSPEVPMITQERAYTSPIWYTPGS